ncbi:MAG TPA: arylesterase [Methylophaga aminisulfidivorans]|uniref:Lysophospholipase L1 and related esterase n=1 Tax=Methylophaga aminisulfidivorans MP TaxID=1026882 RepID=F5T2J8_9GAMM|nr:MULTISPECIES: arylesterase [Methylophaga]EGL53190.1 lysophospholipase L1 and related esterase [Methylophaga aminisulfidivorans MP]HIC47417.1 arylesterase [Methylophaga sp.]HIM39430.1 arylesterase [Methylophaga aminisulfidivorans]
MFLKRQYWFVLLISLLMSNAVSASTLLVMGDSLSAAHNLRPELGWVSLLENQLSKSHPEITVVNASVSGETTQGGLARFKQLLSEHKPSWVIIELGANDALRGYPLTQTKNNLETMIEQAHQADAKVLLLGNQIPQNYGKRYTEMFFNLYKELAEEYQLAYVPFMLKGVALNKALMQADGLHPNKEGQPVVLQNIKPVLLPLLEESK